MIGMEHSCMEHSYKKVLDAVRQHSPLLHFTEHGMTPNQIKQGIVELLSPHFTNQDVLNQLAIELLVADAVNILKFEGDAWALAMFANILDEYRQAAALDKNACFEGCASWEGRIQHGLSEYWSGFYLEADKDDLPLEEFKYEVFRNVGMVIEASLQPLLKELLLQVRIRRGKVNPQVGLETLDLGLAVGELFDTSGYPELFAPPPWRIRLNQWRNMAQHHKTRIENGIIVGIYGKGSNEREVRFKRDELLDALKRIYSIFFVVKTARSIFLIDNISEFQPRAKTKNIEVRVDAKILQLAAAIATQGFELIDISLGEKAVVIIVRDKTSIPPQQRMFHAAQSVYPAWLRFPAEEIKVDYLDNSGDLILTTIGKGSDCEEVGKRIIPFNELSNRVTFAPSEKGRQLLANPQPINSADSTPR